MANFERILEILGGYFSYKELSEDEREIINNWLANSKINKTLFEDFRKQAGWSNNLDSREIKERLRVRLIQTELN